MIIASILLMQLQLKHQKGKVTFPKSQLVSELKSKLWQLTSEHITSKDMLLTTMPFSPH
jgi:hypothetical protein